MSLRVATDRPDVDVVVLSRTHAPLPDLVQQGLADQRDVRLEMHRVIGEPRGTDRHRWDTIARARNAGKRLGSAPYLMFVDDDVVLERGTIRRLVSFLGRQPAYAAAAADYMNQCGSSCAPHVSMGATLFRRTSLHRLQFRWSPGRCECQCCCDDLRSEGLGITYVPGVRATHLAVEAKSDQGEPAVASCLAAWAPTATTRNTTARTPPFADTIPSNSTSVPAPRISGYVLAACDRRHIGKFRRQFLDSLRRAGNHDQVLLVGYGLYPSEQRMLAALRGVTLIARPDGQAMPPVRRLQDFHECLGPLDPDAPAAYWDAADVFFQASLQPLWQRVREHPDKLLAVREPRGFPANPAIPAWTLSIRDPQWRERAWTLLQQRPFLNSGFAAGTVRALRDYFREAHRMRQGAELAGSRDWGDQMALNLYCHLQPERWHEIDEGWNYCAHDRPHHELAVRASDARVVSRRGTPIYVVHGNAHSFRQFELAGF